MAKSLQRQIIEQARELIADPGHWIRGQEKKTIITADGETSAWCAWGAIQEAVDALSPDADAKEAEKLALAAAEPLMAIAAGHADDPMLEDIFEVNDSGDHADVIAMFDLALETV